MSIRIRPLGPCIGAEVDGIDLREPLTPAQAEEIHHGMDRHAVLVFHGQSLTNEQHMAFTLALGPLETSQKNAMRKRADFRLPEAFNDVSNLDGNNQPYARDDRKRLFRARAPAAGAHPAPHRSQIDRPVVPRRRHTRLVTAGGTVAAARSD